MSVQFRHRVSGTRVLAPPSPAVPGTWRVQAPVECDARLNGAVLWDGDALVPGHAQGWVLEFDGGCLDGQFHGPLIPGDDERGNLREIAAQLRAAGHASLATWLKIPPLVPGSRRTQAVRLTPFERSLEARIEHLGIICREPRSHLDAELERVSVSRARRVPPCAAAHLASHPEDWERRTLSGIRPRRVLARVSAEHLDIYENRMVVRLIDELLAHVRGRISRLETLLALIDAAGDYAAEAQGTRARRDRIYRLWAKMAVGDGEREIARRSLEVLCRLRSCLLRLLDAQLYRAVPRQAVIGGQLKTTNILTKDPHYRAAATLWREWAARAARPRGSPGERHRQRQQDEREFAVYVRLLVLHALDACGFAVRESGGAAESDEWLVSGSAGEVAVRIDDDGRVVIAAADGTPRLHLVPVFACLARGGQATVTAALAQLAGPAREGPGRRRERRRSPHPQPPPVVVLYPGSAAERARLEPALRRRLYRFGPALAAEAASPPVGLLPVSPYEIGTVERVARAIRWSVSGPVMQAYPASAPVPEPMAAAVRALPPVRLLERRMILVKPLNTEDRATVLSALDAALRTARARGGRDRGDERTLVQFRHDFETAANATELLRWCPVCDTGRAVGFEGDGLTFSAECACESRWGTRTCPDCRHTYPFLLPRVPVHSANVGIPNDGGEWIDHVYGADALAAPLSGTSAGSFACPRCIRAG